MDASLGELTAGQISQLQNKVVEEKIRLSVSEKEAEARYRNSSRDMAETTKMVHQLDRSVKTDYDINLRFETASGTTDIHVKRNNNLLITVIAVVVAILIVVLLTRR